MLPLGTRSVWLAWVLASLLPFAIVPVKSSSHQSDGPGLAVSVVSSLDRIPTERGIATPSCDGGTCSLTYAIPGMSATTIVLR